ncbi:hypothetical protein C5167_025375 [Papaver somniferum]|uniref:Uncharacterized protein n=1 Tax=Papaver somniferum TaxID=3469 RepID=A0A4Y7JR88_PAPSO|nr:hypothetical protein C5167_025375 [Papaver somniferum]
MNSIEFPVLIKQPKIQLFQLHQMIFQIGQDSPVYGRFCMARASTLIVMAWYQDRVLGKRLNFNIRHNNNENGSLFSKII